MDEIEPGAKPERDGTRRPSRLQRVLPAKPLLSGFSVAVGVLLAIALAATVAGASTVLISIFLGMFLALGLDPAVADLVPLYRRDRFVALLEEITQSVGGVVAGGVTLSAINALVVFVIQLAVGSTVPAFMAIVAFFITLVPMIGSLVFLVIGGVATLLVSPTAALIFVVCYLVYIQVEAYVVTPRVMGRAAAVPGVLVIIGAMVGATLLGLLGALVAIPLTASILIVVRKVWIPRQNRQTEPPTSSLSGSSINEKSRLGPGGSSRTCALYAEGVLPRDSGSPERCEEGQSSAQVALIL